MRIVLVYDQLDTGGTQKLFVMIANLLHEYHEKVTVVIIRGPASLDHLINPDIPVVYLNRLSKLAIGPMRKLASVCRNADVVHVHTYYNWRYVYFTSLLFEIGNAKKILHEHSDMKNVRRFDKHIFSKIHAFIAVNPRQQEGAELFGIPKSKMFLLPNIIKCEAKVPLKTARTNRIIMIGNIRREKYYELALDIMQQLPNEIVLDIYGNLNDHNYFEYIERLIMEKKLSGRINFTMNETNVCQHFPAYDLAIHTANNETGPLSVLEYLGAGLPFFCTTAGQSPALIAKLLPEVVMPTYNVSDWVKAINNFYNEPFSKQHLLIDKMNKVASELLDTKAYYQSLKKVYEA